MPLTVKWFRKNIHIYIEYIYIEYTHTHIHTQGETELHMSKAGEIKCKL